CPKQGGPMSTASNEGDRIAMSQKERDRLRVLHAVLDGQRTQTEAARLLDLTSRHVRRLVQRLHDEGDAALIHGLRGQPSNHRKDAKLRRRVLQLYRKDYPDFGPTFAAEKLAERGLDVSPDTLRRWLLAEGLWQPHRRRNSTAADGRDGPASASWCRWTRRSTTGPKAAAKTW